MIKDIILKLKSVPVESLISILRFIKDYKINKQSNKVIDFIKDGNIVSRVEIGAALKIKDSRALEILKLLELKGDILDVGNGIDGCQRLYLIRSSLK